MMGEFTPDKGTDAASRGSAPRTSQLALSTQQHPQGTVFPLGMAVMWPLMPSA